MCIAYCMYVLFHGIKKKTFLFVKRSRKFSPVRIVVYMTLIEVESFNKKDFNEDFQESIRC